MRYASWYNSMEAFVRRVYSLGKKTNKKEGIMKHTRPVLKLIAASMSLLMLMSALCACAQPSQGGDTTVPETTASVDIPETTTDIYADVPEGNFDSAEIHVLNNTSTWALTTMESSEQLGDTIADAITRRNGIVESKLNITIVYETNTNVQKAVIADQETQTNYYDFFFDSASSNTKLAIEGRLEDLKSQDAIQLEKEWWYPASTNSVAIGDAVYMAFSDAHLHYHEGFYVTVFNKDLMGNYEGLEDPYKLVENGTWTIEKLNAMSKIVATDLDANGKKDITDASSIYGLTANYNAGVSMMLGFDTSLLNYEGHNIPMANFTGANEKIVDAYTKVLQTIYDTTLCGSSISDGYSSLGGNQNKVFSEGRALFIYEVTGTLKQHRDDPFTYGIVPSPKYDEAQKNFISPIAVTVGAFCIPVGSPDVERAAIIAENLAATSHKEIKPAYYTVTLCYKYSKDPQSIAILDTVYQNGQFELAYVYGFGSVRTTIENAFKANKADISSSLAGIKKVINNAINKARVGLGID